MPRKQENHQAQAFVTAHRSSLTLCGKRQEEGGGAPTLSSRITRTIAAQRRSDGSGVCRQSAVDARRGLLDAVHRLLVCPADYMTAAIYLLSLDLMLQRLQLRKM